MRILVYPIGGLANRMRVIDSVVNLSEVYKCKLKIYWIKDKGLNCDYCSIWKPISCIKDIIGRKSEFFFYLYRRFRFVKWILMILEEFHILSVFVDEFKGQDEILYSYIKTDFKIQHYWFLVIKTCENFYPGQNFRSDLFQLQSEIEERVRKETERFYENTIGVHIRRKDNIDSIENSPLELFEEQMLSELDKCPSTTFYLVSDDQEVKNYFRNSHKWKDKILLSQGILTRNSKDGIVQAAIEMYALARTKKILGSYWSSFSEIAAYLGNIPLKVVKNGIKGLAEKE